MKYEIDYSDEAKQDLKGFNKSQENRIVKAIRRVALNPLPQNEGGYGKPLGNKQGKNLTGLCKIVLMQMGIRVVYKLIRTETVMKIIVIAARADDEVYDMADKRNQ